MPKRPVIEQHTVSEEGDRIDRWVSKHFVRLPTRGSARKAAKRGELLLNGQVVESSRFVKIGDRVELTESSIRHPVYHLVPEVAYVDERCAIVIKPPGLLVNGNQHRTLEHSLPNSLPPSAEPDALLAPRPVHRLDFETTGLLAVARCHRALVAWGHAFEERQVEKRYRAIVVGHLQGEGDIELPLDGREAVSRYRVIGAFHSLKTTWCTEVELEPLTGRMHQLRRHLQHLGFPILGDKRYHNGVIFRGAGIFLAAVHLDLPDPDGEGRVSASIEPPYKFRSFRAREERRWARWHATNGLPKES